MATKRVESGLRNYRIDFAREDTFAEIPDAPEFLKYSGVISEFSWEPDETTDERRTLGSADPQEFQKGVESHEISIVYDLHKWLTSGGSPHDAAYDGLARDSDNLLPNSHLIVAREDKGAISADATVNGSTEKATRLYTVGQGGLVSEVSIIGESDDTTVAQVELSYMVHKGRSYQIDQPDASTEIAAQSTDAGDTSQTLTIENEDGSTSVDLALDGTTTVNTTETFSDIDALQLDAETVGDVEVHAYDATNSTVEDQLSVIPGSDSYAGIAGDLGVPAVSGGSREDDSALPSSYEHFAGGGITRDGTEYPHDISSATFVAENDIEEIELAENIGMALYPGNRELSMEANMFGEQASHDSLVEGLQTIEAPTTWSLDSGDLVLEASVLNEPGERAVETGEAVLTVENVFRGQGVNITEN